MKSSKFSNHALLKDLLNLSPSLISHSFLAVPKNLSPKSHPFILSWLMFLPCAAKRILTYIPSKSVCSYRDPAVILQELFLQDLLKCHACRRQNELTAIEDLNALGVPYAYEYRCIEIKHKPLVRIFKYSFLQIHMYIYISLLIKLAFNKCYQPTFGICHTWYGRDRICETISWNIFINWNFCSCTSPAHGFTSVSKLRPSS